MGPNCSWSEDTFSVPRHGGIDLLGPEVDAAGHVSDVLVSATGECHRRVHAADSVVAYDDDGAAGGHVVDPVIGQAERANHGSGQRGDGDFVVFAHVDQKE